MTSYFEELKKTLRGRSRIPVSLVEKHLKDVCFLIDTNFTYVQSIKPRVRWLRPLPYGVTVDDTFAAIISLLAEDVDAKRPYFGTFLEEKARINMNIKVSVVGKKKDKLMKKLEDKFGEKEEKKAKGGPLQLTQGKGEDEETETKTELKADKPKSVKVTFKKKKKTLLKRKPKAIAPEPQKQAKVTKAPIT